MPFLENFPEVRQDAIHETALNLYLQTNNDLGISLESPSVQHVHNFWEAGDTSTLLNDQATIDMDGFDGISVDPTCQLESTVAATDGLVDSQTNLALRSDVGAL
jgi:hypothetical protein